MDLFIMPDMKRVCDSSETTPGLTNGLQTEYFPLFYGYPIKVFDTSISD